MLKKYARGWSTFFENRIFLLDLRFRQQIFYWPLSFRVIFIAPFSTKIAAAERKVVAVPPTAKMLSNSNNIIEVTAAFFSPPPRSAFYGVYNFEVKEHTHIFITVAKSDLRLGDS